MPLVRIDLASRAHALRSIKPDARRRDRGAVAPVWCLRSLLPSPPPAIRTTPPSPQRSGRAAPLVRSNHRMVRRPDPCGTVAGGRCCWRGKGIVHSRPPGRSLSGNAIVARVARLGGGALLSLGESTSAAFGVGGACLAAGSTRLREPTKIRAAACSARVSLMAASAGPVIGLCLLSTGSLGTSQLVWRGEGLAKR